MTFLETPDRCPHCGANVDDLDVDRDDRGDALHDHLAEDCLELEDMARGDRLLTAYSYGDYRDG